MRGAGLSRVGPLSRGCVVLDSSCRGRYRTVGMQWGFQRPVEVGAALQLMCAVRAVSSRRLALRHRVIAPGNARRSLLPGHLPAGLAPALSPLQGNGPRKATLEMGTAGPSSPRMRAGRGGGRRGTEEGRGAERGHTPACWRSWEGLRCSLRNVSHTVLVTNMKSQAGFITHLKKLCDDDSGATARNKYPVRLGGKSPF